MHSIPCPYCRQSVNSREQGGFRVWICGQCGQVAKREVVKKDEQDTK